MISIFSSIRKFAEFLKMASIDAKEVKHTIDILEEILRDAKNFNSVEGDPLQFSPEGVKKVESRYKPEKNKNLQAVIKQLLTYIEFAGKFGDHEMALLSNKIDKIPSSEKLEHIDLKSLDFASARIKVEKVLEKIRFLAEDLKEAPKKKLTPAELKEMQETGVI